MTGKERMIKALRFEPVDRCPHFESMFELSVEAFGQAFPATWEIPAGATQTERKDFIDRSMAIYAKIIEKYQWDALCVYSPWGDPEGVKEAKKCFGDHTLIGGFVGRSIFSIENVEEIAGSWMDFSIMMLEEPEKCQEIARALNCNAKERIQKLIDAGADFIYMPNDVGFNSGPFISPGQFHELCFPYLCEQVELIRQNGAFSILHTDGMIMPILEDLIATGANCLQSVDPMAGMDIAKVKQLCYGKMALMGNVQCSLLQDGPREAIRESALYALNHCGHDSGYIFSSSNSIFQGLPLENYEYMLQVYHDFYRMA